MSATVAAPSGTPLPRSPYLLTPDQAAGILGVTKRTLRQLVAAREGPRQVRINKRVIRYRLEDIEEWVRKRLDRKGV